MRGGDVATQEQFLIEIGKVAVLANFWTSLLFFAVVATFWKWWQAPLGRSLATVEFLLLVAFTPQAMSLMFGINTNALGYQWLVIAVIMLIPVRLLILMWVLFRLQTKEIPVRAAVRGYFRDLPAVLAEPWVFTWRKITRQEQE